MLRAVVSHANRPGRPVALIHPGRTTCFSIGNRAVHAANNHRQHSKEFGKFDHFHHPVRLLSYAHSTMFGAAYQNIDFLASTRPTVRVTTEPVWASVSVGAADLRQKRLCDRAFLPTSIIKANLQLPQFGQQISRLNHHGTGRD